MQVHTTLWMLSGRILRKNMKLYYNRDHTRCLNALISSTTRLHLDKPNLLKNDTCTKLDDLNQQLARKGIIFRLYGFPSYRLLGKTGDKTNISETGGLHIYTIDKQRTGGENTQNEGDPKKKRKVPVYLFVLFAVGCTYMFAYHTAYDLWRTNFPGEYGGDIAIENLNRIITFLKDPENQTSVPFFSNQPKGILLSGPPGVGKKLVAKSVAEEAGVPFFYASGYNHEHMNAVVGAQRLKHLFAQARTAAPCVVFLDDFNSIGGRRDCRQHSGEIRKQLLEEMDSVRQNKENIVVMAATDRWEYLDKAVRRIDRFGTEITVTQPNFKARRVLLNLYTNKTKKDGIASSDVDNIDKSEKVLVDLDKLAEVTEGFSWRELQSLVNRANLQAAITNGQKADMSHFEFARKNIVDARDRKDIREVKGQKDDVTGHTRAYGEACCVLVQHFTKDWEPLTLAEAGNGSKKQLQALLDVHSAIRLAGELMHGGVMTSTGSSNELMDARKLATTIVQLSDTANKNDQEKNKAVQQVLDDSYDRARTILKEHREELISLAEAILEHDTLSREETVAVVEGKYKTVNIDAMQDLFGIDWKIFFE